MNIKNFGWVTCLSKQEKPKNIYNIKNQKYNTALASPKSLSHYKNNNSLISNRQSSAEKGEHIIKINKKSHLNPANAEKSTNNRISVKKQLEKEKEFILERDLIYVHQMKKWIKCKSSMSSRKNSEDKAKVFQRKNNKKHKSTKNKYSEKITKWLEDFKLKNQQNRTISSVRTSFNVGNVDQKQKQFSSITSTKQDLNTMSNSNNTLKEKVNKNENKKINKCQSVRKQKAKGNESNIYKPMKNQFSNINTWITNISKKEPKKEPLNINFTLASNYRRQRCHDSKEKISQLLYESEKEIWFLKKRLLNYFSTLSSKKNSPKNSSTELNSFLMSKRVEWQESHEISLSHKPEYAHARDEEKNKEVKHNPIIIQNVENISLTLHKQLPSHYITISQPQHELQLELQSQPQPKPQSLPERNKSISTLPSSNPDDNMYLSSSLILSKYIMNYFDNYKSYPLTNLSFYKYGRQIGKGAFGKVIIGLNILSGRIVAIKSFNKIANDDSARAKINYEANLMKRLNHSSIVKVWEMFESENFILIIMEYINGGNWYSFVKKHRRLNEKTAKLLFKQIILGIKYMHQMKIVHRDIKLENILIDINNTVKICDFGIGKILQSDEDLWFEQCGTLMYMAPELLLWNSHSGSSRTGYLGYPVDIWSSGIALYIMLSGALPFTFGDKDNSDNLSELQYNIINKDPKPIDNISDEAKSWLKGLLNKNPWKRFTCDDILNHNWFKDHNTWAGLNNKNRHTLFTKGEINMLSKNYIDYKYAKAEDLKETFTITNLINDEEEDKRNKKSYNNKNVLTKSFILAPYNSMVDNYDSWDERLVIANDIIAYTNKAKEKNLQYEINNNDELDNGILINSKYATENNNVTNNSYQDDNKSVNTTNKMKWNKREKEEGGEDGEELFKEIDEGIVKKMELFGYKGDYVKNCWNSNIMCHATAVYFLMKKYEYIND